MYFIMSPNILGGHYDNTEIYTGKTRRGLYSK